MLINKLLILFCLFILTVTTLSWSATDIGERKNVELTVYNQDFALVKENRILELKKGINELMLEGIASQIDPTSVHFKSLTDPYGTYVIEQNYDYDLVNTNKLMEKYIGKDIQLEQIIDNKKEIVDATLLSTGQTKIAENQRQYYGYYNQYYATGGTVMKIRDKFYINPSGTVILPSLSEGLILKPTLDWTISAEKEGKHNTELSYITKSINWTADYVLVIEKDDKTLDLTGWVTLDNRSGVTYDNAKLKLMAGDVHLVNPQQPLYGEGFLADSINGEVGGRQQFREKGFADYHLYTLQRPATIKDNQTKQVEFTHGDNVPVQKVYFYDGMQLSGNWWDNYLSYRTTPDYGTQSNKKVNVWLEFKNSEKNNLGMPLPAGKIRVYQKDIDDSQEFIGEDKIEHTPKDENVNIYIGNAFDIVGERKQTSFKMVTPDHVYDESFEIKIRNHKKTDAMVRVVEHLYRWSDWEITQKSQEFNKIDSRSIQFYVTVPKDGETVITYTVRYTW